MKKIGLFLVCFFGFTGSSFAIEKLTLNDVLRLEIADQKAHQNLDAKAVLGYTAPNFKLLQRNGDVISRDVYALGASQLFERVSHYLSKRSNHEVSISEDGRSAVITFLQEEKIMLKSNSMVKSSKKNVKLTVGIVDGKPVFTKAEFFD